MPSRGKSCPKKGTQLHQKRKLYEVCVKVWCGPGLRSQNFIKASQLGSLRSWSPDEGGARLLAGAGVIAQREVLLTYA